MTDCPLSPCSILIWLNSAEHSDMLLLVPELYRGVSELLIDSGRYITTSADSLCTILIRPSIHFGSSDVYTI